MERCQNPTVISLGSIGNAPLQQKHVNKGQLLQFAWRFCRNVGTAMCDTAKLTAAQWKTEHPDISWTVHHNVNGRNPPNQLRLAVCPIIYRGLYIPGGCLGFAASSTSEIGAFFIETSGNESLQTASQASALKLCSESWNPWKKKVEVVHGLKLQGIFLGKFG